MLALKQHCSTFKLHFLSPGNYNWKNLMTVPKQNKRTFWRGADKCLFNALCSYWWYHCFLLLDRIHCPYSYKYPLQALQFLFSYCSLQGEGTDRLTHLVSSDRQFAERDNFTSCFSGVIPELVGPLDELRPTNIAWEAGREPGFLSLWWLSPMLD